MYGRGLNSIRWRFTVASALLTALGVTARELLIGNSLAAVGAHLPSLLAVMAGVGAATFLMASQLTGMIASLQRSTEALATGDLNSPVDIDCQCEIGGLASSFRKMTQRMNANILRINALAYTDPITRLPNRGVIDRMLERALAPGANGDFKAAVLFIDLDHFKQVNDTLGHDAGDELLRQAATRIVERGLNRRFETLDACIDGFGNPCERLPQDIVFARFAGDEFLAVLPGVTDHDTLAAIGQSILDALQEPFFIKLQDVQIGASIGIAVTPDDTLRAQELITCADLAMYRAKRDGRAGYSFFDPSLRSAMLERTRTEADLRLALQRGELLLHFQPKVVVGTLALFGVEALVRWQHPTRGLLMPAAFIDLAEQAGLMSLLGKEVLRLALLQARAWQEAGTPHTIAVNVSPSQFTDPDFVEHVLSALREVEVEPRWLSIEITESIAMTDFAVTALRLATLRSAGIRVAIDDFGIGFSNLSQLSRLPMDDLKIDRSLIMGIGVNSKSEAVIRAIQGMTQAMGYKTIAEGVETPEQVSFLKSIGCDLVQGYYFGKPMPVDRLEHWIAQRETPARVAELVTD